MSGDPVRRDLQRSEWDLWFPSKHWPEDALLARWYVRANDTIGGWAIMPMDEPPSSGCLEIADFVSEEHARHIAALHNYWLDSDDAGWKADHGG